MRGTEACIYTGMQGAHEGESGFSDARNASIFASWMEFGSAQPCTFKSIAVPRFAVAAAAAAAATALLFVGALQAKSAFSSPIVRDPWLQASFPVCDRSIGKVWRLLLVCSNHLMMQFGFEVSAQRLPSMKQSSRIGKSLLASRYGTLCKSLPSRDARS